MELSLPHQSAMALKGPLKYSAAFHLLLLCALVISTVLSHRGETWGGAGGEGSININLVGNIPAIPLPKPDVVTTNRVVDETRGLYKEEPTPKPPDDSNALYLPKFD